MNHHADEHTFGVVALPMAARGWRPIPLVSETKKPTESGWSAYNDAPCPPDVLRQMASQHFDCATGIALPDTNVAIDTDIVDQEAADAVGAIADTELGVTPLVRIGLAPKSVRIYRADGSIQAIKPHPIEIFSGSGQVVAFGWHAKAGRPYLWPHSNPLDMDADDPELPLVTGAQIRRFLQAAEPTLARLRKARKNHGGAGIGVDATQRLRELMLRGLPFARAAGRVLQGAADGGRHYSIRAVISAGFNHGVSEEQIRRTIERHAPPDMLALVTDDGYLERTFRDFQPLHTDWTA